MKINLGYNLNQNQWKDISLKLGEIKPIVDFFIPYLPQIFMNPYSIEYLSLYITQV